MKYAASSILDIFVFPSNTWYSKMHVKLRMRYAILFCMVVFGFWIILSLIFITQESSEKRKSLLDWNELVDGEDKINLVQVQGLTDTDGKFMIGMIKDENDQKIRNEGYEKHAFNELISIRIGLHREIPDTRHNM